MNGGARASSFWAQKSREVKAPTAPASTSAEPLEKEKAATKVKSRIMLKGVANGATSTPKKTDWADSDDDEEFIAGFSPRGNPSITAREIDLAPKDARIERFVAVVGTKDARIQQLEEDIEEQAQQIISLEVDVDDKGTQIEQLKENNHTQYLYVQELVAELDDKTRRIQQLEVELDERAARLHDLEMDSESQTQVSSGDIEYIGPLITEHAKCTEKVAETAPRTSTEALSAGDDPKAAPPRSDATILGIQKPSFVDFSANTLSNNKLTGPASNDSQLPKLWSPDIPKKAAPVEKPKVLKMAIDTSNFGKKPACIVKKPEPSGGNGFLTPTYGQSTKHRSRTNTVPMFDVGKDIRHMPHAERVLFANGPDIAVMLGSTIVATLPKYILMQCSGRAHKHFTENSTATAITFPVDSMDVDAAKAHLQWMDEMTYQGRVYSLTLHTDERHDSKNLKICQAARAMGLNHTYVGHFTKVLCDRVRSKNCSLGFISLICELAYPDNDPVFDCLANNLVNQQLSKPTKKLEHLDKLFVKYPPLKEKMVKIEQRVKDARAGEKRKGGKPQEDSKGRNGGRSRDVEKPQH